MKRTNGTHQQQELERLRVENCSLVLENNKLAKAINDSNRSTLVDDLRREIRRRDIALVSITPIGSEYANEPEKCAKYANDRMASLSKTVNALVISARESESELDKARAELAKMKTDNQDLLCENSKLRAVIRSLRGSHDG